MSKPLYGSQQTVENSSRDGNTRPPDLPLEKPVCRSGSNWTWNNRLVPNRKRSSSRLYIVILLMQSISYEMTGWVNHKLESILLGEISTISDYADDTTLMAENEEELTSVLMKVKDKNEKALLKLNIK